jgi:hypothetical protein
LKRYYFGSHKNKKTGHNIGYKILVVRRLVKLIALAKFLTVGQEIAPKIHQHFIPGLVRQHGKCDTMSIEQLLNVL